MYSVITTFEQQVERYGDKLLFAFLDSRANIKESYSYTEFNQRSKCIAAHISGFGLSPGDRVLLAYSPGIEIIASFFACVRLGIIPVPVYPPTANGLEASVQKMSFIAQDCGASAVLTDRSCYRSFKINEARKTSKTSELTWVVTDDADESKRFEGVEHPGQVLFIQYTSGSTSEPKGVMVSHENIIRNADNVVDHLPVGVSWLPQYHDMGLIGYYLFFALKGGTTYGFSPADFIQRPALWLEAITKFSATASSAPNFAFDYCLQPGKIPETLLTTLNLSTLRFLMNAAEPIRAHTFHAFYQRFSSYGLRREAFFGAYGLAEFTLAVSNYGRTSVKVDLAALNESRFKLVTDQAAGIESKELMSCGKALKDTRLCIVNDTTCTKAGENGIGEIWIKGGSKCLGYYNRPELSNRVFNARLNGTGDDGWLRTGDLGFIHEDELYVCGRIKDLIIVRGINYYPQDLEALVEENPLLRKGCTVAFASEEGDSVVIVAGVKNPGKLPKTTQIEETIAKQFGLRVRDLVFVPARTISKTSSGKLRRFECRENYLQNTLQSIPVKLDASKKYSAALSNDETQSSHPETGSALRLLFSRYLLSGNESAAIGHAGLDSMKIAEFGHDLKTFLMEKGYDDLSEELDLKLLQKIPVSELFSILNGIDSASLSTRLRFRRSFHKIRAEFEQSEEMLMRKDASMNLDGFMLRETNNDTNSVNTIFLTGATGFFGAFLLKSLLEQNEGSVIYVLVRASSIESAYERLQQAFKMINPQKHISLLFEQRVKVKCGDLACPQLGLNDSEWDFLSKHIHTIYHNGACVNYLMDYETMRAANVLGTRELIRLSINAGCKSLNYISTTFIFGWSAKDTLFESDSNATMEHLDFGYSQSKWVADQLVLKAMREGLPARIFRPALISPSVSGEGYNFDISIRLLSFMLKHGISTSAENQVSFTPADIAANNLVAISNIPSSIGRTFHLTRDEYSSMRDVTEQLSKLSAKPFDYFKLRSFVPEVISRCTKQDLLFPLLNFLVRSVDNINTMEFKRYDNSNYREFRQMSPWGKKDPSLEEVVKGIYLFMSHNNLLSSDLQAPSPLTFASVTHQTFNIGQQTVL